jgi:hypothetical protein
MRLGARRFAIAVIAASLIAVSFAGSPQSAAASDPYVYPVSLSPSTGGKIIHTYPLTTSSFCYEFPDEVYSIQVVVSYGKVTATTIYINSITYYYYVRSGSTIWAGPLNVYQSSTGVQYNSDWGTSYTYANYGWHFTRNVSRTFGMAKGNNLTIQKRIWPGGVAECVASYFVLIAPA